MMWMMSVGRRACRVNVSMKQGQRSQLREGAPRGALEVTVTTAEWGSMHRSSPEEGRWDDGRCGGSVA